MGQTIVGQFFGKQPVGKNKVWLQLIAESILEEPTAKDIIEEVREECGLVDPLTKEAARANRKTARSKQAEIRECLARVVGGVEWPRDRFETNAFNYVFRPEEIRPSIMSWADERDSPPTDEERRDLRCLSEVAYAVFVKGGFQKLFSEMVLDLLLARAIDGSLKLSKALPAYLVGNAFAVPLYFGECIVVSISSRFDDIYTRCDQLQERFEATFPGGAAHPKRKKRARDVFICGLYVEIDEALKERAEHIEYMSELLGEDEGEVAEMSVMEELLKRVLQSEWAGELKGYNLETKAGRRAAKNFLSQIVHRERAVYKPIIAEFEANMQAL